MKSALSAVFALVLLAALAPAHGQPTRLEGRWILNHALTAEVQPENRRAGRFDKLPRPTISIGGMPLPRSGAEPPPPAGGSARDPQILRCTELTIRPDGDRLELGFSGGSSGAASETLVRGNQQGLVSRWNARRLTSNYETVSRTVSQTYEVRRDGRLLVTVKLDPTDGRAVLYKRVFDPAEPAG